MVLFDFKIKCEFVSVVCVLCLCLVFLFLFGVCCVLVLVSDIKVRFCFCICCLQVYWLALVFRYWMLESLLTGEFSIFHPWQYPRNYSRNHRMKKPACRIKQSLICNIKVHLCLCSFISEAENAFICTSR